MTRLTYSLFRVFVLPICKLDHFGPARQLIRIHLVTGILLCGLMSGDHHCRAHSDASPLDQLHRQTQSLAEERHATQQQLDRLAERIATMERDFAGDAVTLFWQGIRADRDRDKENQAEVFFEQALKAKSASGRETHSDVTYRASVNLGLIRLGQGRGDEALALAELAIKESPGRPDAYRLLVDASFQLNRLGAVTERLRDEIAKGPNASSDLLDIYFGLLMERGERDKLRDAISHQLQIDPTSPSASYFAASVQTQQGMKSADVDVLYIVASMNGGRRGESTIRAQDYLSRRVLERLSIPTPSETTTTSEINWAWVADMIARYEIGQRRGLPTDFSELPDILAVAKQLPAHTPTAQVLKEHLVATLYLMSGKDGDSKSLWEKVVKQWPRFVPAMCRLAEVTEADGSPESLRRANSLWKEAISIEPENPLVRDHVRLGLDIHASTDGVVIDELADMSPIVDAGLAQGDILLSIDGKSLKDLHPRERLQRVRLFTGGDLTWKTKSGDVMTANVPLLLLD